MIDQPTPSQFSTNVSTGHDWFWRGFQDPTATQLVVVGHDTAFNPAKPPGVGLVMIDQPDPFQVSINVVLA